MCPWLVFKVGSRLVPSWFQVKLVQGWFKEHKYFKFVGSDGFGNLKIDAYHSTAWGQVHAYK